MSLVSCVNVAIWLSNEPENLRFIHSSEEIAKLVVWELEDPGRLRQRALSWIFFH